MTAAPDGEEARRALVTSIVARLGRHPVSALAISLDPEDDASLGRWLIACCLLGGPGPEETALAAYRELEKAGLGSPRDVASSGFSAVEEHLGRVGLSRPERIAGVLVRVSRGLVDRYDGSLRRLAADADGLEELASRLARLAPGFGRAAVVRYLTPLRALVAAAGDLPATPGVRAAAIHLGLVGESQDEASTPASLDRTLGELEESIGREAAAHVPSRIDVEAALDRLGRIACLRGRTERCPLDADCPARSRCAET